MILETYVIRACSKLLGINVRWELYTSTPVRTGVEGDVLGLQRLVRFA